MTVSGATLFSFDRRVASRIRQRTARAISFSRRTRSSKSENSPIIVGIDEAGRGSWAGPVVAAAVCLNRSFREPRLNDSKQLTPELRNKIFSKIQDGSCWSVGKCEVPVIDAVNILNATHRAMAMALERLLKSYPFLSPDMVLVDGLPVPHMGFPQMSVVKGDARSAAIAAASVVAKVSRDKMMRELHEQYPLYGFARHKGYGTSLHRENLFKWGPSPAHRKSFAPVAMATSA